MKNLKSITTFILLSVCTLFMTSCSDKDHDKETPAAKAVAGSYTDDLACTVMNSTEYFENVTFVLTATDDANVNIDVPSFGNPPMQIPAFTVTDVKVAGTDGNYLLATTEFSGTTTTDRTYSGTLQGKFENNTLTININLQYGSMPMPLICEFVATK